MLRVQAASDHALVSLGGGGVGSRDLVFLGGFRLGTKNTGLIFVPKPPSLVSQMHTPELRFSGIIGEGAPEVKLAVV
jgi:hypothetical protein